MSGSNLTAAGPNAQQIEYWNEVSGPKWVELESMIEEQIEPLGARAMDAAEIRTGERVVDVGCGCGQTSLQIAQRVGPGGSVLGIDISTPMLERARDRAREAGMANVRFENADAQMHRFESDSRDLAFSRFGVMFFADPPAAFANLASSIAPSGRLVFVCWQELKRNPWMLVPVMAAAAHVELPSPPPPGAPGPFSLADPDRLRGILATAGFSRVDVSPLEDRLRLGGGGGLERAVAFVSQMGPAGAALREAPEDTRARALEALREALAPHESPDGLWFGYAAWIVTARV